MKFPSLRFHIRKPSPRALVGISLIAVSIAGTTWVVSTSSSGTVIVLATHPLAAGQTIAVDDIVTARVHADIAVAGSDPNTIVGRRTAVTVAEGEQIVAHDLDFSNDDRATIAIPLGIEPAHSITAGSRIQLWFLATDDVEPPLLVATDAIVEGIRAASFGGGSTVDVSVNARESNAVLMALGGKGMVVATTESPAS